jgi:hypothetical protein
MNNLPTDQNSSPQTPAPKTVPIVPTSTGGINKEMEFPRSSEAPMVEEKAEDVELSSEVEAAGVEKKSETIHLPPDVKQMGVESVGPSQPVVGSTNIQLPLDDNQIVQGLHSQIINSLKWLAVWCVRQLKKAHLHLQVSGDKVTRVKD